MARWSRRDPSEPWKGLETYCLNPTFTGYLIDGGYREYSIADADFVGIVPADVDLLDAAPLTCAGVTTYRAVKGRRVGPSWTSSA